MSEPRTPSEKIRSALDAVESVLCRYVILPDGAATAAALFTIATYLLDRAEFAPMLIIKSPELRCGKTTLLTLLAELVREPETAANASAAALFRLIESLKPTLLLDEIDTLLNQKSETTEAIRGILNAGHRRGRFSCVLRVDGEKFEVKRFSVFGHKILAGIGNVPATWADRSIVISLRRKSPEETTESLRIHRLQTMFDAIREQIVSATAEAADLIDTAVDPVFPPELNDRARDNWESLLQIADFAGGAWPEAARKAAVILSRKSDETASAGVMLLSDIEEFLEEHRRPFSTETLVNYLETLEERPWSTWSKGRPIGAPQIARLLKPFEIRPEKISIFGEKKRGYRPEQFQEAFKRYLSPEKGGTPVPETVNSIQNKEMNSSGQGTGFHFETVPKEPEPDTSESGSTSKRYPEPGRYREESCNSLFSNKIEESGTGYRVNSGYWDKHDAEGEPGGVPLF